MKRNFIKFIYICKSNQILQQKFTISNIAVQNRIPQIAINGMYRASSFCIDCGLCSNDLEFGGKCTNP